MGSEVRLLSRDELIARALALGVERPAALSHAELCDEVLKRSAPAENLPGLRGWLGKARDLVAQAVKKGLHLPDAARLFRLPPEPLPAPPPPLPTVTLAEIYAAQGHLAKSIAVLDQVLLREPEHRLAAELRARLAAQIPAAARMFSLSARIAMEALEATAARATWQLRPLGYARARHDAPGGLLVVRVLHAVASASAIEVTTLDLPICGLRGETLVGDLPPGCEARACLGWRNGERFVALAVAAPIQMPPG